METTGKNGGGGVSGEAPCLRATLTGKKGYPEAASTLPTDEEYAGNGESININRWFSLSTVATDREGSCIDPATHRRTRMSRPTLSIQCERSG
jgi:hypothetical protein